MTPLSAFVALASVAGAFAPARAPRARAAAPAAAGAAGADGGEVPITTLIFDVDDTLYPVSSGFSDHRNGAVVQDFMVDELGFADRESARIFRDAAFREHHSTLKGLSVAAAAGALPGGRPFDELSLGRYWAARLAFGEYLSPARGLAAALRELAAPPPAGPGLRLVVFSNGPREYVRRCLAALGLAGDVFADADVFGVEDVLPACKPEAAAFARVLDAVGAPPPGACVMFEDSMKNVRACRALGVRTVLVDESRDAGAGAAPGGEAALLGDVADADDPAVDRVLARVDGDALRAELPELWRARFRPRAPPPPRPAPDDNAP